MQKSKFIAMLLAVAMVASMVVVPAFASGEPYTITLTANSIAAAPGGTISLTLSTAGTIPDPGVTAVGAVIKYPAGWTLTAVDDSAAASLFSGINLLPSHNDDGAGTYTMYWGMDAFTTAVGDLATLTFTIPADAALADYPFIVENGEELNVTGTLDGEGKLIVGSLTDVEVAFAGCSVTVGSACPLHADAEYTAVDAALAETWAPGGDVLETGHYRLESDVTLNSYLNIASGIEACIDLNGHTISGTGRLFFLRSGGVLTITDSVGTGLIQGGTVTASAANGGTAFMSGGSTFNLYGGTVIGGTVETASSGGTNYGGNFAVSGTLNMYGGMIKDGTASGAITNTNVWGGNMYVSATGTFNMYGGTISSGVATGNFVNNRCFGGNIYGVAGSKLNLYGGTVAGGTITRAVFGYNSDRAMLGGNIYSEGAVVIRDTTVADGVITGTGAPGADVSGAGRVSRAAGANICVSGTSASLTIENSSINGGSISLSHNYSSANKAYMIALGGSIAAVNANVTIKNSTVSGGEAKVESYGTKLQTTNTITVKGGSIYIEGAALTISDNSAISGGSLGYSSAKSTPTVGGGCISAANATVTITDSTVSNGLISSFTTENVATSLKQKGLGGNIYQESGDLNISSSTIADGNTDYRGGNICTVGAEGSEATVNLTGTTNINYGTAALAASSALYAKDYSTINMSGDTSLSRSRMEANTTMNLYSGYISQIYIVSGITFTMYGGRIGTLEGTAGATINNGYVDTITSTVCTITSLDCAHVNTIGTDGKRVWHNEGTCSVCGHNYVADGDETACETCGVVHEAWHGAHTFDAEGNCTVNGCTKTLVAHDDSCNCGETVTWTPWDGNDITGGHYYLTDNMDSFSATITDACLDLNGYTLKVEGAFDASIGGNVIDTVGTGKLADNSPAFNPSNSMLPIHVGDGYVFETPVFVQNLTHTGGDATGKFGFYLNNLAADTKMDEALKEGKITIQVNVTWDGGQMTCALSSEMPALATYADNWDTKMLLLTLTGLTDITGLTCTAQVYANGVTVQ